MRFENKLNEFKKLSGARFREYDGFENNDNHMSKTFPGHLESVSYIDQTHLISFSNRLIRQTFPVLTYFVVKIFLKIEH